METRISQELLFQKICQDTQRAVQEFLEELKKPQYLEEIQSFIRQNANNIAASAPETKITFFFIIVNLTEFFYKQKDNQYQQYFNQISPCYDILMQRSLLKNLEKRLIALLAGDICRIIEFYPQAEAYYQDAVKFCPPQEDSEMTSYCHVKLARCFYAHGLQEEKEPAPESAMQKYQQAIDAVTIATQQPKSFNINKSYLIAVTVFVQQASLYCGTFYSSYQNAAQSLFTAIEYCLIGLKTDSGSRRLFLQQLKNCFQGLNALSDAKLIHLNNDLIQSKINEIRTLLRLICQPNEPDWLELDNAMNSLLSPPEVKRSENTHTSPKPF